VSVKTESFSASKKRCSHGASVGLGASIVNFYLYLMIRRILNYLAAILFFCSLPLQVFTIGDADVNGFGALIYGWVGVGRSFGWSWLANPLFILTLFLFFHRKKRFRRAAVCTAATAFLLSLSFLLVDTIPAIGFGCTVWPRCW